MNVSNTSANSFLQASADPRLRGQTVSLYMLAMRGGLSLGSLLTGAAISFLGIRYALLANGTIAVAVHALVGWDWLRSAPRNPIP
jgi:predicted MFS family arabinose efflux permease